LLVSILTDLGWVGLSLGRQRRVPFFCVSMPCPSGILSRTHIVPRSLPLQDRPTQGHLLRRGLLRLGLNGCGFLSHTSELGAGSQGRQGSTVRVSVRDQHLSHYTTGRRFRVYVVQGTSHIDFAGPSVMNFIHIQGQVQQHWSLHRHLCRRCMPRSTPLLL